MQVAGWTMVTVGLFSACCLISRRLHDLGLAGWWTAAGLALGVSAWMDPWSVLRLPVLIAVGAAALWLSAMPGQARLNRFGRALKPT